MVSIMEIKTAILMCEWTMSLLYSFDIGTCVTNKLTTGFTVHLADNGSVMWIICKSKGWSNQVINLCVMGDASCGSRVYRRKSREYEQNTRQDHPIGNTETILQHYKYIYIYIYVLIYDCTYDFYCSEAMKNFLNT